MKKLLYSLLILANIIAMPIQAMTAFRPALQSGRRTLATNLVGQASARSIGLRSAMGTLTSKVQSQQNDQKEGREQNKKKYKLLVGASAAAIGVGLAMQNTVYAHENTSVQGNLRYDNYTGKYEYYGYYNGNEFSYLQVPIPVIWVSELRDALKKTGTDPDTVPILGFNGLPSAAMAAMLRNKGPKLIIVNVPYLENLETKSIAIFGRVQRIIDGYHEAIHIKKHANQPKNLERTEVEADLGAWRTMSQEDSTKKIIQQKIAYDWLLGYGRSNPYLNSSEEIYYGSYILKNPNMIDQQEQELVDEVLKNRTLSNYQQQLNQSIAQLARQGEIEVSQDILNDALYRDKSRYMSSAVKTSAAFIIAACALPPLMPVAAMVGTSMGLYAMGFGWLSNKYVMQRYSVAQAGLEKKRAMQQNI